MGDEPIWVVFLPTPVIQAGSSVGDGGVDAGCEVEVLGGSGRSSAATMVFWSLVRAERCGDAA
jgi:hypothetical protein